MIAQEQSVLALANEAQSYEEGSAAAALSPGEGCYITEDANGDPVINLAGANSQTRRVVREQRNPPRSLGSVGDSPLDDAYAADDNVETVGLRRFDRARLRLSANASADPAGNEAAWDDSGRITDDAGTTDGTNAPTTFVGRVLRVITRSGEDDLAVVEVY